MFVEGLSHFLDDFFDVVEIDFFCDGYEFVAAYAEDAVLAYDGAHGAGHFPECFIACFVAVGVVDVFEVIEVSADEGDGFALRDVLHKSHEAVPVHDSCELVGVPELSQAFVDVSVADEALRNLVTAVRRREASFSLSGAGLTTSTKPKDFLLMAGCRETGC